MEELLIITIGVIISTFVGTISGFGSSTVLIPVLLFIFPYAETLLLAGVLHWFNDVWKISLFRQGLRWKLIALFGVPSVIATYIGASIVFNAPELLIARILGAFFLLYSTFLMVHRKFKIKKSNLTAISGGALSGFFAGIFGLGGAVRSAFLTVFNLPKAVYIATIGAIAFVTDLVRVSTYYIEGARLSSSVLLGLIVFIPASFYGAQLAKLVVDKVPQKYFRVVVAVFLLAAGVKFLFFP